MPPDVHSDQSERAIYRRALQQIVDEDSRDSVRPMLIAAEALSQGNIAARLAASDEEEQR